jgi:hypothetical protein
MLLVVATLVQTAAGLIPFLAWITWPLIIHSCYQLLTAQSFLAHSVHSAPAQLMQAIFQLRKKPSTFISLILYGLLGLIIFRGLTEALRFIPSNTLAKGGLLPVAVITLLPYALAEAIALLFIAACAVRLVLDDRDPLVILSAASRDLLLSPFSFLALVLTQAMVLVYWAVQLSMATQLPSLATVLGHAPYALMALAWACGQPHHQTVTS